MKFLYSLVFVCLANTLSAQTLVTDTNLTLDELVEYITTNLECTSISNITSPNNSIVGGEVFNSYASFEFSNEPNFPFQNGIVMTTNDATDLTSIENSGSYEWAGDTDLEALIQAPGATYNATVIEFDFVPFRDQLSVDYIFASQEYPLYVCDFADTFAFIVSGPGISNINAYDHDANPNTPEVELDLGGLNIATLPETTIPVNPTNVHIAAGCELGSLGEYTLPQFYDVQNSDNNILDYGGQIVPLTAQVDLIPGETYHIKLVIGDRSDTLFDSAVFIDANSFVIGTIPEDLPYEPGLPVTLPSCWETGNFASYEVSAECSLDGQNHLKLYGGNYSITTTAVNTDGLSAVEISFDLLNGCEDLAEAGENLIIEYFDGSNWLLLDEIDPADLPTTFSGQTSMWQTFNYTLTSGLSQNLMLRFIRFNGDNQQDDISLTNLKIQNANLSVNTFSLNDVTIFPNPAKNIIHFNSIQYATGVEIFDFNGKLVSEIQLRSNNEKTIDITHLASGVYLVKISSAQNSVVRKIVKE
jgi:hypothetical protein